MALKDRTPMKSALDLQELQGRVSGGLEVYLAEVETKLAALAELANDLKAKYNAAVTLINELKSDYNAHCAADGLHYNGTTGVHDTVNTTSSANAAATSKADVTI